MSKTLVLEGVFRELCREGMALSVRDYLDALSALLSGYGGGSRAELVRLCQSLWARSDDEDRLVQAVLERATRALPEERQQLEKARAAVGGENAGVAPAPSLEDFVDPGTADAEAEVRVQFASAGESGLPLPRAVVQASGEAFVLSERPLISERAMATAWRRFYRPARGGPPTELDLDATVCAQARSRVIAEPVLIPARVNRARVVVAIDVSASMVAWRRYADSLVRSLRQGRLASTAVFYFENIPDELWRRQPLDGRVDLRHELGETEGSALLILSDGGAARGGRRKTRVEDTLRFFDAVTPRWRPIVWLNPTPRRRWNGTTAERIAADPRVVSFSADARDFTQAIDALRGRA